MSEVGRHAIIEFAGLPGVGKSTITRGFRPLLGETRGPQVPPFSRRTSPMLYGAAASFFLSLRPLGFNDVHRCLKLIEAYNAYRIGLGAPLLLEQGLIQRLWSTMADRAGYSPEKLEAFIRRLAEAPPGVIVWVKTTPEVAAQRILHRPRGNSRYERMMAEEIIEKLLAAGHIYETVIGLYRRHSTAAVLEISGEDPVEENVARVASFVRSHIPGLEVREP